MLVIDDVLHAEARRHAIWMADKRQLTHGDFSGRLSRIGWGNRSAAENIAVGQRTGQDTVSDWLDSTRHRQNMLGPYERLGVGYAIDYEGKEYRVAIFGL